MSEHISPAEFVSVMFECFDRGQDVEFTPQGTSMLPMLDGKSDKVTFTPKKGRLKKYDVAFYVRSKSGQLVLHRMVGFDHDGGIIIVNNEDGNKVSVDEYIIRHKGTKISEASNSDSSNGNDAADNNGSQPSNSASSSKDSDQDENDEGEIPRSVVDVDTSETGPAFPDI